MKCRRCREPAVIDVRRHNAAFCRDCFLHHCREQVRRAIDDFEMLQPGERVLVAVSGGKDSLGLWHLLAALGYPADGLYVGLGIGDYSDRSGRFAHDFADQHGYKLHHVDIRGEYGFDIPEGSRAAKRAPCSACGLSKRHLFNAVALEHGYAALATGHNLDDEAAVLFGNVLRWERGYLGRQYPVLPAADGFVRKVKPLIRLGERELAAYCVLAGIDYIVEECPMAAGNRHLGYKEVLNTIEERSPGSKAAFVFGFLERAHDRFAPDAADEREDLGPAANAARPHPATSVPSAACRRAPPAPAFRSASNPAALSTDGPRGTFAAGDRVLLTDNRKRRHLVTLAAGGQFHTHAGIIEHDALIGHPEGITVRSSRGARLVAVRPTLSEYILEMPRGAQVIYPKDIGPILMLADVFPGARIFESGIGSGALTTALLRAVGPMAASPATSYATTSPRPRSVTSLRSSAKTFPSTCRYATPTKASTRTNSIGSCSTYPSRGGS